MSDRLYVDPLTNSVREERALFSFAKNLGLSFGSYFRLGVLTYARCLSESRRLPRHLEEDYKAVSSGDKDYLQRLLDERIEQDQSQSKLLLDAYEMDVPKPSESSDPDWSKVPDDQKVRVYLQKIFSKGERDQFISELLMSDDETRPRVFDLILPLFIERFKEDPEKPFTKVDAGEIRRVFLAWAEAEGGV